MSLGIIAFREMLFTIIGANQPQKNQSIAATAPLDILNLIGEFVDDPITRTNLLCHISQESFKKEQQNIFATTKRIFFNIIEKNSPYTGARLSIKKAQQNILKKAEPLLDEEVKKESPYNGCEIQKIANPIIKEYLRLDNVEAAKRVADKISAKFIDSEDGQRIYGVFIFTLKCFID
ncbi:MAG: hypothetical protein PVI40_04390 [Chlamydiota bacterium]|jgi:hypothetical protein